MQHAAPSAGASSRRGSTFAKFALKLALTAAAFYLLLTHEVRLEGGESVSALRAVLDYLPQIDPHTFWRFTAIAFLVKLGGIVAAMVRWALLLRGQGIVFPFWHIATTFLIGRFLGTFLPSTLGLDGYKLYDAARFSGCTVEVVAATVVEKGLGLIGILITFLVTLPLGYGILGQRAALVALITVPAAAALMGGVCLLMWKTEGVAALRARFPRLGASPAGAWLERLAAAAATYRTQTPLLLYAALLSFVVHFATAAVYFFTALAVGATHADFWEIAFASTIQIFATVLSPFTIAGEGVREIVQALLLAHTIGMSQSIISAALGFWAAEAPTLSGAVFYFMRRDGYRPRVEVQRRCPAA